MFQWLLRHFLLYIHVLIIVLRAHGAAAAGSFFVVIGAAEHVRGAASALFDDQVAVAALVALQDAQLPGAVFVGHEAAGFGLVRADIEAQAVGRFVAELHRVAAHRAVLPGLVICGRVVMSGSMMPITTELDEIFVTAANAGARKIMLPEESRIKYERLRSDLKEEISVIFYKTPVDAARKALGVE